jgi:hypothetical protein
MLRKSDAAKLRVTPMEILKKEKSHFSLFIFRFVLSLWNVADWFIYESL